jgi:hypothetical protein
MNIVRPVVIISGMIALGPVSQAVTQTYGKTMTKSSLASTLAYDRHDRTGF